MGGLADFLEFQEALGSKVEGLDRCAGLVFTQVAFANRQGRFYVTSLERFFSVLVIYSVPLDSFLII